MHRYRDIERGTTSRCIWVIEFEQSGAAPFFDDPVWGLEIGGAGETAQALEVFGCQEERVGELVLVDEEVGWEGEVGVQFA